MDVRADESARRECQYWLPGSRVVMLLSYHSALRIRLLASWIPCLLLIDHTTLDFVKDDGDLWAAERSRSFIFGAEIQQTCLSQGVCEKGS
jgi:hypothetical protein